MTTTRLNSSPSIEHCTIVGNNTGSSIYGGGIYAKIASGDLLITDSIIANNATYNNSVNKVSYGGGIFAVINTNYSLRMDGCIVTNNGANANYYYGWAYGGGIFISGNANLNWCLIGGNSCTARVQYNVIGGAAWGGGIYSDTGRTTLNNCLLKNNSASTPDAGTGDQYAYGGALYISSGSVAMTNCIVQDNIASGPNGSAGGGICVSGGLYDHTGPRATGIGTLTVVNCTIAYNNSEGLGVAGGSTATNVNSIFFFNASGGAQIAGVSGTVGTSNVTYCDVQGGYPGEGNINANPIFLSTDDLIIVPGSPCINKGNTNSAYSNVYFPPSLGRKRNDMGAHGGPGAGATFRIRANPQVEVALLGGVPGYNYLIQASTNLVDWETVQQPQIAHLGDVAYFLEPMTNTLLHRFYRLNLGQ